MRACLLTAAAVLALGSSASAQLPPWLLDGERLTYELSYLRLVGGTMVLEAGRQGADGPLGLSMRARSSAFVSRFADIDDTLITFLDPRRVTTLSSRKEIHEGRHRSQELVLFDPERGVAHRWKNGEEEPVLKAPPPILDTLAAVYVLRTLPLASGRTFNLEVQSGGRIYPLLVEVRGIQRMRTTGRTVDTFEVEPRFREGGLLKTEARLILWLTTDATHTPLRIRSVLSFGSIVANLQEVVRPYSPMLESEGRPDAQRKELHGPQTW